MIKVMQLIRRKAGTSRQDFIDYYEHIHAPLMVAHFPYMQTYRRNYPLFDDPAAQESQTIFSSDSVYEKSADFDVFTETIFASRDDMEKMLDAFLDPDLQQRIAADEARFVAPGGVRRFIVEVHESDTAG